MNLSIQFKKKELVNTSHFTLSALHIILLNDISFNIIIYIWYILYSYEFIKSPNPFFALSISLIQNILIFIYLLNKKNSYDDLIKYTILLIILKIMPLISLYLNDNITINYFDVYITVYLYIIYIFICIIIYNILLHNNINVVKIIFDDFKPHDYKENIMDVIYDKSYNDVIKQII